MISVFSYLKTGTSKLPRAIHTARESGQGSFKPFPKVELPRSMVFQGARCRGWGEHRGGDEVMENNEN